MSKSGVSNQGRSVGSAGKSGTSVAEGSGAQAGVADSGGKKPRKASVKYTNIVRSEYKPAPEGQTLNVLDERVTVLKGRVVIPGIEAGNVFGEPVIRVPSTGTAMREPTLRQLLNYLQSLDAK